MESGPMSTVSPAKPRLGDELSVSVEDSIGRLDGDQAG
jgi:hypothetical protein